MRFLVRLIINAIALWVATRIVSGISYEGGAQGLLAVALVFGVINAFVGPLIKLLTLPLVLLTLGLFTLIINAILLWLTSVASRSLGLGFHVQGAWAAILGAIVISIVSTVLSILLADDKIRNPG
jgi:putative membrane protein